MDALSALCHDCPAVYADLDCCEDFSQVHIVASNTLFISLLYPEQRRLCVPLQSELILFMLIDHHEAGMMNGHTALLSRLQSCKRQNIADGVTVSVCRFFLADRGRRQRDHPGATDSSLVIILSHLTLP